MAGGNFPAPTSSVDPLSVVRSEVVVQFRNQAEWFENWLDDLEAGLQAAWMAWKLYKLAEQMDIGLNNDLLTEAYKPGSLTSKTQLTPAWIGYWK